MIFGAHVIVYSKDPTADRAFLRDVLGFASVDAGHGWLIFALPPAEVAVHPSERDDCHGLYFMCDDLRACGVRRCRRPDGVRSRRSGCPVEARSVFTSPGIHSHWL